ncbi:tape measure protein [uncultured Mediterranean phage uvMED]|nr:tape measure protein [uncultured Mediterranean phage uvMED]BAR23907.1 phage tail tape measure protein [uncultured Mediterranean phage uvMED]BAR23962.1 phage tail tape measure protein [uncultured Mediterranean phage uvMED]BAR23997.1 phage tail tape measure protein [uncultured Mediterranean phage uvMED]BAR24073.1 phage tail tape measure protein [uncultured Mediterranean phage uvMED]
MAAEYEVNIKINSQEIETQLGKIDRKIAKIGKPKGGSSRKRSGIAGLLPSSEELRAADRGITQLTARTKNIQSIQDKFSQRRIRALLRSNNLNEKELRVNRQLTNEARQRLRLLSQSGAKGFDATRPQGRQMSENINALANAQERRARLANKINEMEAKGLNVDKLRKQLGKATTEQSARRFASATKEFRLLEKIIRGEESKLRILKQQQQGFASSPIRGGANMPGSPLARQARNKRLEQVGLGAGFPLLFGGGAGSVIGGGLGGLTGSFGAQIALSALGQQVDQFIASVVNVGTALTSASGTVEMFREKNLFSSEAVKRHAFELEQQGEMQQLATLLTKDLASQIGVNAVKNFQELGGEVKEFLKTINQLFLAVQGFVAGPLAKLLGAINTVLGGVSTEMQFKNLRGSLTGDAAAEFERIFLEARGTRKLTGRDLATARRQGLPTTVPGLPTTAAMQRALEDPRTAKLRQTLDVTGQTTTEDTLGGSAVKAAQRLLESSQRRIQLLKLETEEIKKATGFQDRIAAAQLLGDERTVARLTKERELSKIKLQQDKAIARINKKLPEAQQALERQAIKAKAVAQAAEVRANFEREIASIVKDEQNEAYKKQAEILKKNFELQQKELKKAQDLAKDFADTVKDGFVDGIKAATDETRSLSDALANMLNRLSDQLLNIAANVAFYGNAQGTLSQGQGIVGTILGSLASVFNPFGSLMAPGGRYEGMPKGQLPKTPPPLPPIGKALGGAVSAGRPYMVGERGPELFVPGAQGNIVPNNAMGSTSVVVNVDASGTEVQGNQGSADQLGRLIGAAVQAELIKQKRPGGLLTR